MAVVDVVFVRVLHTITKLAEKLRSYAKHSVFDCIINTLFFKSRFHIKCTNCQLLCLLTTMAHRHFFVFLSDFAYTQWFKYEFILDVKRKMFTSRLRTVLQSTFRLLAAMMRVLHRLLFTK